MLQLPGELKSLTNSEVTAFIHDKKEIQRTFIDESSFLYGLSIKTKNINYAASYPYQIIQFSTSEETLYNKYFPKWMSKFVALVINLFGGCIISFIFICILYFILRKEWGLLSVISIGIVFSILCFFAGHSENFFVESMKDVHFWINVPSLIFFVVSLIIFVRYTIQNKTNELIMEQHIKPVH